MDLARYSKDTFKEMMGDLVKYEEYVTEVSVTKQIRGGKLPARVFTIVIMEPEAINLKELEDMKKQQNAPQQQGEKQLGKIIKEEVEIGVPKK